MNYAAGALAPNYRQADIEKVDRWLDIERVTPV
jgi:hypothetical protein